MVWMLNPGHSVYSKVPIDHCDEVCQETALCDNAADWRCSKPTLDKQLYNINYRELQTLYSGDELIKKAKEKSFTRPETYEEGLERYFTIAQAVFDVSHELSQNGRYDSGLVQKCSTVKARTNPECAEIRNRPWRWSPVELQNMILTVSKYESGFRRDVHSGQGVASRGDCEWKDRSTGKWAKPGSSNAFMIAGSCRSVCLGQINIGKGTTPEGWTADDLVGLDYDSTKRCLTRAGTILAIQRNRCTGFYGSGADWARSTFTAYGTGGTCTTQREGPTMRGRTFWRLMKDPIPQDQNVLSWLTNHGSPNQSPKPLNDSDNNLVSLN